jgi:hypothetical protein
MNTQVTEYIENAQAGQKEIMEIVRTLIHQNVSNVTEEFKWSRPVFKTTKDFSYFLTNKNYVTIGFTKDFEKLNDPNKLLEGTGKTMRHIKLKKASDIDTKLLKEWFKIVTAE